MEDRKLQKLEQLLNIANEDFATGDDLAQFVEAVLTVIKDLKGNLDKNLYDLKSETQKTIQESIYSIDSLESRLKELVNNKEKNLSSQVRELSQKVFLEISRIEEKIPVIPNIPDLLPLEKKITELQNKPSIMGKEIVDKINDLQLEPEYQIDAKHIKNLPKGTSEKVIYTGGGNSGGGRIVKAYDLSSSLDGVTKTFTLPAFWRIVSIHLSSFPGILRPTTDFTTSGFTITFTSEISASTSLASGQTCIVIYADP